MATRTSGDVTVNLVNTLERDRPEAQPGTPFCVALLGDFTGRGNRGITETGAGLRNRGVWRIDRDNFSEVLSQLKVELRLPILGKDATPVTIRFSSLDDFHPDHLFEKAQIFEGLREMRHSLKDPAPLTAMTQPSTASSSVGPASAAPQRAGNIVEQILEAAETRPLAKPSTAHSDLDEFVRQVVQPYSLPNAPNEGDLVAKVDRATSEFMRKVLHHADFQALEAGWRAVHFLVSQLETDEDLRLYLIDVTKAELAADLSAADEITAADVYQLLLKEGMKREDEPWSVLAGNFTFGGTDEDAALLNRLSKLAEAAGAPLIAAAHADLLGCDSLAETPDPDDWKSPAEEFVLEAWRALRKSPEASSIGLALPRFLLRLPYGKETEPVERFDFEEMEGAPKHEDYLWGNPSFACVYLLAQAFSQYGWDFRPGIIQEISGLPLHVYKQDGESRLKPCAEALLTQRAAEAILDHGLMPLLSFVNQDNVRLARFQSIADPAKPLRGRWR